MSSRTIRTGISHTEVREAILSIPQGMCGNLNSDTSESLTRLGIAMFTKISEAFFIKSQGGTDLAGDRWAPLSTKTISRRVSRGKPKKSRRIGYSTDPARRRIQGIIRNRNKPTSSLSRYRTTTSILMDSGELFESLSPNSNSSYQVLKIDKGSVTIGTSKPGAMTHHHGSISRNIPQRRLWPPTNKWPDSWWQDIKSQVQDMVISVLIDNLRK